MQERQPRYTAQTEGSRSTTNAAGAREISYGQNSVKPTRHGRANCDSARRLNVCNSSPHDGYNRSVWTTERERPRHRPARPSVCNSSSHDGHHSVPQRVNIREGTAVT